MFNKQVTLLSIIYATDLEKGLKSHHQKTFFSPILCESVWAVLAFPAKKVTMYSIDKMLQPKHAKNWEVILNVNIYTRQTPHNAGQEFFLTGIRTDIHPHQAHFKITTRNKPTSMHVSFYQYNMYTRPDVYNTIFCTRILQTN